MARPIDETRRYVIRTHKVGDKIYASTQPAKIDEKTGKKVYRYIHWGRIVDNTFLPNKTYTMTDPEERAKLKFPKGMDTSAIQNFQPEKRKRAASKAKTSTDCKLYGDIWLLMQIALKCNLKGALLFAFDNNEDIVNEILTLVYYQCATGNSFNRVECWQRIAAAPSDRPMTPSRITRLMQKISEKHRMDVLRFLAGKTKEERFYSIDTTTRSMYGNELAEARWDKNKEDFGFKVITESVVYSLNEHMPIYYRIFPRNMPDVRGFEVICNDLKNAGFKNVVHVTDRGYDAIRNLGRHLLDDSKMLMGMKTSQRTVLKRIKSFESFNIHPKELTIDPGTRLYMGQFDEEYKIKYPHGGEKIAKQLKLNIYLDIMRRNNVLVDLEIEIDRESKLLEDLRKSKEPLEVDSTLRSKFPYFKLTYSKTDRILESYTKNETRIAKDQMLAGFFANATLGLSYTPKEAYMRYKLRDEQEKHFQSEKDMRTGDRIWASSEDGAFGRYFLLFLSMILKAQLFHIWKNSELHQLFPTTESVLDEMRSIRLVERSRKRARTTPFVGKQVDIVKAFGFNFPNGGSPVYTSAKMSEKKRSRSRKPVTEISS